MLTNRATTSLAIALTAGIAMLLTSACGADELRPQPELTPVPVHLLYNSIKDYALYDEGRLNDWKGHQFPPFYGSYFVEDSTARFLVENDNPLFLDDFWVFGKDAYVECKFDNELALQTLSVSQDVALMGVLDKAFPRGFLGLGKYLFGSDYKSVMFKNCVVLPLQSQ